MYVFGDNSVFNQALNAKEQTFIAKARGKLEVVLSNAQIEKNTNNQYDEIEDLNRDITNRRTYINGSEEFYFDNEGPEINIVTTPESEKSFTIEINASDNCEIVRYDIYIDDNAIDGTNIDLSKPIITIDNMETRTNHRCRVIAYDRLGNSNFFETECATMLFAFDKYSVSKTKSYELVETEGSFQCTMSSGERSHNAWTSIKVDPSTGEISGAGKVTTMSGTMSYYSRTYPYTKVYDHDYAWFRTTGEERLTDPYKSPSVNRIDGFFITAELKWINPVRGDYIDRVWGNSGIDFETSCESTDGYWYEYIGVMEKRDS